MGTILDRLYLLKLGEIHLKGENKQEFIAYLRSSLKQRLAKLDFRLDVRDGRFYLYAPAAEDAYVSAVLSRLPGINAWAHCYSCAKELDPISELASRLLAERLAVGATSFKIEARRSDKSFPLDSYGLAREVGHRLLEAHPSVRVDVHNPDTVINIEIRERSYLYCVSEPGVRGLPVGCAGRGLLLLSGGIDSPVAGFKMISRGLALEAAYFNAYPYTSQDAWNKVANLSAVLASYGGIIRLHTVPFTEVQLAIKKFGQESCSTLYLRAAMMMAADRLCKKHRLNCIVTGESMSQVASQTAENMRFSQSFTDMAVMRPLCGTDKEEIIKDARRIGSYDISILPYADCCVLFSPKFPVIKADFQRERAAFSRLGLETLVEQAVQATEIIDITAK